MSPAPTGSLLNTFKNGAARQQLHAEASLHLVSCRIISNGEATCSRFSCWLAQHAARSHTVQSCIAGQGGLLPIHREATCSVVQYACTPHLLGMSSRASPSRSSARTGRRPHHLSGLARPLTPSNWTCWKALCGHLHLFPQRLPPLLPLFSDCIGRRHGSPLWCHSNGSSNGPGHYPLP